jgi:fructose transport system permease protein
LETTADDGAAAVTFEHRRGPLDAVQHALHRFPVLSPLFVLILSWLIFAWASETGNFATWGTTSLLFNQAAVLGTLAVGQTLIVLTAGIDLAVGTGMLLTHIVIAKSFRDGLSIFGLDLLDPVPAPLALIIGLICAMLLGALHGFLVTKVKLPPFIVTLGTFYIFQSLGLVHSKAETIAKEAIGGKDGLILIGSRTQSIGPMKVIWGVLIMLALYLVFTYILSQTSWGRHVYAVGGDPEAARLAGINVNRVIFSVYVVAGVIYAVGAWVQIGRAESASTNSATDINLETITAVVIGGTSLFGGRGRLAGSLIGALIVVVFRNGLKQAGVNVYYQNLAIGLLIIVAVALDQWIRRVGK